MSEIDQIRQTIAELEELAQQMENEEVDFSSGDVVNYNHEGESGVAVVESVRETDLTARVMAVAGENYEPTDDVLTLAFDQVSHIEDSQTDSEDSEDSDEDENTQDDIEKSMFVSWNSKNGLAVGRVADVVLGEPVIIPETGDEFKSEEAMALIEVYKKTGDEYEETGVHVAHPVSALEAIDDIDTKQRRLMVKVKNYNLDDEEDKNIGQFKGLGSAYGKVDLGGDTVAKGAYSQTIMHNDGKVQLMFDHGWAVKDVAGIAYLEDSDEGLMVQGKMPLDIKAVEDGYKMLKFMLSEGKPLGLSIGYQVVKSEPGPNGTRVLKEIALEEMTITPWPMDTHARIRDAKNRKIGYNAKRRGWQTLSKSTKTDAPTGNQDQEGDYKSLSGLLTEIKTTIEENHV